MSHRFQEYPKALYHKTKGTVVVESRKEQEDLGGEWAEQPHSAVVDKGDAVDYKIGGEIAEAKTPIKDVHATEKTGADSKYGGDGKQVVKKEDAAKK